MNERFAADPVCFHNSAELKTVLQYFGVHSGRYLGSYPEDWERRLISSASLASPVEAARVSTLLRRAKDRCGLVPMPSLMWMDHLSWVENAGKLTTQNPPKLDGLVVPNETARVPFKASTLDNFELPPTAEERIAFTPSEYVRVSERLLLTSHELALVDPYLNPCDRNVVAPVLESLLAEAAKGKCKVISLFARERDVLSASVSREGIRKVLQKMLADAAPGKAIRLNYYLLDDAMSRDRMHDRYLLSVKGGIELSQGFQKRRNGKATVSPMSPALHREIWSVFLDKKTDMHFNSPIVV